MGGKCTTGLFEVEFSRSGISELWEGLYRGKKLGAEGEGGVKKKIGEGSGKLDWLS